MSILDIILVSHILFAKIRKLSHIAKTLAVFKDRKTESEAETRTATDINTVGRDKNKQCAPPFLGTAERKSVTSVGLKPATLRTGI